MITAARRKRERLPVDVRTSLSRRSRREELMPPGPDLVAEKRALRRSMIDLRGALGSDERAERSRAAVGWLATLPELAAARAVAGYLATQSELDLAPALAAVERRGGTVVYPRVTDGQPRLRFHWVGSTTDLRPGAYGILEPPEGAPEVAPQDLDVILLPGLAFDPEGNRLGYGGGYYDEGGGLVRRQGRALLVGVGFDFQLIDRCPAADGDVNIDRVVTDARVVHCPARGIGSES
jgi:5-formyltetrahydrofolate cyclo-ligase